MNNLISTYRFQFHKGFNFDDFEKVIPYIAKLGIKTIYASPIFEATPCSMHGYDVVNPLRINPEIGTIEQLYAISKTLKKLNINWLQDIVPNHMAFDQHNLWLMDVLEKGRRSTYASYFDILWDSPVSAGKLMVPFLGSELKNAIAKKEVQLVYKGNQLSINAGDQNYPVKLKSYETVLLSAKANKTVADSLEPLFAGIDELPTVTDRNEYTAKHDELKKRLIDQVAQHTTHLNTCLATINNDAELLSRVADEQEYRLCFWQETNKQINFRRFFTVNGLICLNIQLKPVFDLYNQLIKRLLNDGVIQGLRVDHIDGLYNPQQYLQWLRELAGDETYIIVEKILESGETFPSGWPVQGNTGYDFLSVVNNLFTNVKHEQLFSKFYHNLIDGEVDVEESIFDKKALILHQYMAGELENLYRLFLKLQLAADDAIKKTSPEQLKNAIGAILIYFPVYRFYGNHLPLASAEAKSLTDIFKQIRKVKPELSTAVDLLENAFIANPPKGNDDYNTRALRFYQRLMQFTGPLMAKGVEDTLMYTYNRFINHNEVGDSPDAFGVNIGEYHRAMQYRQKHLPLSMNATSTHDTKRGEDVRARLNALTDIPEYWAAMVKQWKKVNEALKTGNAPDDNDEYFIYQAITGSHPMPGQDADDFKNRLQDYMVKALREAKLKSSWADPDEKYEENVKQFIVDILDQKSNFMKSFPAFHKTIADYGIINSLAQVLLKYTSPGLPDLYQGCEQWDFSMVDPDNRRPVDYETLGDNLNLMATKTETKVQLWENLWQNRYNPQIKLELVNALLTERGLNPEVFAHGEYIPLTIKGKYKDNVMAFIRHHGQGWYLVALPLQMADLDSNPDHIATFNWDDTRIILPSDAPAAWEHLLFETSGNCDEFIKVGVIFGVLPLAILKLKHPDKKRSAGILMHVSSLPSAFGIGDIGPEAHAFVDFLHGSRQKYWQMLPVNPTDDHAGNSPYSSTSSMAGNVLLISPELMVEAGLLKSADLKKRKLPKSEPVDYEKAAKIKRELFDKAFDHFIKTGLSSDFDTFKTAESYWLDDYAIYEVIKSKQGNTPWYHWPAEYKWRKAKTISNFSKGHVDELEKIKWLQFVFHNQWNGLKAYCDDNNVRLIGDMPFYVNYDSVDVWSHPEFFNLDQDGNMAGMAGVPPDYFSADGQLWGMPVYKWDTLKTKGYRWWIDRIKKNLEYFDLIRLDHFRAFADYWEVPGGELTAVNGTWQPGPGTDFFKAIKRELHSLPFIAEDLGDINEAVYNLRDGFNLPGMNVVQFAFDDDLQHSPHIPHNYIANSIAYTGTHDNDTTVGWYKLLGKAERKRIDHYAGKAFSEKNAHKFLARMCYASVAQVAIIPMQDILGLDEKHRMNIPSSISGNWSWRMKSGKLTGKLMERLREETILFNR